MYCRLLSKFFLKRTSVIANKRNLLFPIFNTVGRSSLLLIGMAWLREKNSCLVNDNTDVLLVII